MSRVDTKSLVESIEDEIYDYGYEGDYFPVGGAVGDPVSDNETVVPAYIDPALEGEEGQAIYKLMPYGEVLRFFHVLPGGAVVLDGDPQVGFPASQPDRKTVYLRDEDVSRMKRDWIKSSFEVQLSPGARRIQQAAKRQKMRTGFSQWESVHRRSASESR
ncbi:MAG: hypothetical protein ACRD4X_08985 [Candidatus Acidiferrales bacterium]